MLDGFFIWNLDGLAASTQIGGLIPSDLHVSLTPLHLPGDVGEVRYLGDLRGAADELEDLLARRRHRRRHQRRRRRHGEQRVEARPELFLGRECYRGPLGCRLKEDFG